VASVKSTDFKAKEYLKEVERHYLKKKWLKIILIRNTSVIYCTD
jgi:hypothetical protein